MSFLGQRSITASISVILAFGGITAFGAGQGSVSPTPAGKRFDVIGGISSRQILVRIRPDTAKRTVGLSTMRRSTGYTTLPASLSQRMRDAYASWGGRRIRPFYPAEFRNPELAARYGLDRTYIIEVPPGTDTPLMAAAFRKFSEEIELADTSSIGEVTQVFPDDPDFSSQYGLHNTGQTGGWYDADIDAPEAWGRHTGRLGTVVIAIIDTGVGPHIEFTGRLVPGINLNDFPNGPTFDESGHGTHVAGIAAAEGNNAIGIAGVTWGAHIMPVRVTNAAEQGTSDQAAAGLIWATDHGADVCNLSLQFYDLTPLEAQTFQSSVNYAHGEGALVIAAAGNGHGHEVAAPGRFENCLAVSATDEWDDFAWFSNYGPEVDVCAPGDDIWSTMPDDDYDYQRGTSMSAPHVSGLAALIKSYAYYLTNEEIRTILTTTTDDLGTPGLDEFYGHGRVNAYLALSSVIPSIAIVSSWPPNGAIDARQPSTVDGSNPDGWRLIDVTFDDDTTGLMPEDFTVTTDPDREAPAITNITTTGDTATIEFDGPIPVSAWTIITHNESNTRIRIGYLPGDVDGDRTSTSYDVDALIDAINGVGDPLETWCTDINRSGDTTAQDVLREIDLLNGAGEFQPFQNVSLP